jgi:DNA excision repair protein ERCC-2
MNMVLECIDNPNYLIVTQKSKMSEDERNEIIELFNDTAMCKVGFFVMGGIFSEGLDFIGDSLNGVIIVGVGLPLYCDENNLLKEYFDIEYQDGFEYAYTYPGFTKVVQAVGRVIRSETDRGVAILIDERFTYSKYLELMPKHWKNKKVITTSYNLKREIIDFYNKK